MQGNMTYTGIAVLALSFLLKDVVSAGEIQTTLDATIEIVTKVSAIVGTVMAAYGRWRIYRAKYRDGGTSYGPVSK